MRASKADRPVLIVANRKNQTICETVDQPVCPIPRLAVVETIVIDNRQRVEINSARERYVMLREVDGFLGRVEISHLLYIQSVRAQVKPGAGVLCDDPLKTASTAPAITPPQEQGGNL